MNADNDLMEENEEVFGEDEWRPPEENSNPVGNVSFTYK